MKTYLQLAAETLEPLPAELAHDDVRWEPALVRVFLEEYTRPGDMVLDPFAGFGTTLRVAEEMGRQARGLEYDATRCAYACSSLVRAETLVHGDARKLAGYGFPPVDFSMTGIPFAGWDEPQNPFTAYTEPSRGYDAYLEDLTDIYRQVAGLMRDGATAVVEAANLKGSRVTTLAWDAAKAIEQVLRFEGEVVVCWDPTFGFGYDHSYCMVFRK